MLPCVVPPLPKSKSNKNNKIQAKCLRTDWLDRITGCSPLIPPHSFQPQLVVYCGIPTSSPYWPWLCLLPLWQPAAFRLEWRPFQVPGDRKQGEDSTVFQVPSLGLPLLPPLPPPKELFPPMKHQALHRCLILHGSLPLLWLIVLGSTCCRGSLAVPAFLVMWATGG